MWRIIKNPDAIGSEINFLLSRWEIMNENDPVKSRIAMFGE